MPDVIQAIGAVAGLATVVGLGLLSVLHVSQARDVKQLREWAGRAPERSDPDVVTRPRRFPPRYGRIGIRPVAIALVGLLVFGVAAARLTGDDGESSGTPQASDRRAKTPKRTGAALKPATVTVAVLNGTTVPSLAAALRDHIAADGFRKGTINNFSDQQLAESVVQYAPGQQAAAKAVGRSIGISRHEPVDSGSRALAPGATVIVIAGADKAP